MPERAPRRRPAVGGGLRPRLSAQAARARATAERYYARFLRERESGPDLRSPAERERQRALLLATAGVVAVFALWCAVRAVPVIEADVAEQVRALAVQRDAPWLQAEVAGRHVRLYGIAPNAQARRAVVDAVAALAAVARVDDHLVAAPPAAETAAAAHVLPEHPDRLLLVFDGRELQLVGTIGSQEVTTRIVREAERRYSAPAVATELRVTPRDVARWQQATLAASASLALLELGQAELVAGEDRLTITGVAPDVVTLGAVREELRRLAPADFALRVDVVPLYREGHADPSACRRGLAIITDAGALRGSGDFSGLDRRTRLTLDQVARLLRSCDAGLLVITPDAPAAAPDGAGGGRVQTLARDVRRYLLEAGVDGELVAVAPGTVTGTDPWPLRLQLVFADSDAREN